MTPARVIIRSYQVGFGDCFLLSFEYAEQARHVLIDFGSTALPDGLPPDQLERVAADIAEKCAGKLTAVVATHRHKDHISGFTTKSNRASSGRTIADLKPDLVLQPWTEDPDLDPAATGPAIDGLSPANVHITTLANMQIAASEFLNETRRVRYLTEDIRQKLIFLGETNIPNRSAVENLASMGAAREFAAAFRNTALQTLLPGVSVDVLGPPTVEQWSAIKGQRSRDADEFWHLVAQAGSALGPSKARRVQPLFPDHVADKIGDDFPVDSRWLIRQAKRLRGDQMLRIVRILDQALNNTSLILLFRCGGKSLLFSGDAQIESWSFALSHDAVRQKLRSVDLYKVGHHGSLNATPKSLWDLFDRRSGVDTPGRLTTLLSTMSHRHGDEEKHTEVPRKTLVHALAKESNMLTTQSLSTCLYNETVIEFS